MALGDSGLPILEPRRETVQKRDLSLPPRGRGQRWQKSPWQQINRKTVARHPRDRRTDTRRAPTPERWCCSLVHQPNIKGPGAPSGAAPLLSKPVPSRKRGQALGTRGKVPGPRFFQL